MAFLNWLQNDTAGLFTLAAVSVALLLVLIMRLRLEPFIALIVTGVLVALVAGVSVTELVGTPIKASDSLFEKGFAGILGHIAPIIGLGTVLGAIMERSGGADALTERLLRLFGPKGAPLAMGITGLVLGIPVFFDIGIFVLAPLVYVAARRGGRSLVLYAMPMLAGLSMTHAFLPPHPGPVTAGGLLGVGMGWVIAMGLLCGIPAWLAGGVWWGSFIGRRVQVDVPEDLPGGSGPAAGPSGPAGTGVAVTAPPPVALISSIIAVPLVLILAATVAGVALPEGTVLRDVLVLLGTPAIALTLSVLLALYLLGIRRGTSMAELGRISGESLRPVGMILLVVGAGAFFGKVLQTTGVGDALAGSMTAIGLPVIASAYLISAALRIAQGSATVAIVTTAGIIGPTVAAGGYSQPQLALIVVAVSAGSIIASHVNDGGFWIVAKYFNMTVKQTLMTWTVLETILSVVGFAAAALVWALV
ncbi:gluconate:H+ symporter [Pseudonocardia sp. Ae505_Ps2]|uniref:GntP family permease n=1 Tax=Pseudonocardia sp. Ae505_Ps2 TaxID=1885034 RepID=UPI00094EB6E7|nr:gluconate:H+ symporter [Pseudonocardia sp. Ae505_Ps2]OLM12233.1 Low-affinity gluconate/H+ symporter GntU [Pseudonocardia sp. Ae505_Ps2]